jgi:hypothetical protein
LPPQQSFGKLQFDSVDMGHGNGNFITFPAPASAFLKNLSSVRNPPKANSKNSIPLVSPPPNLPRRERS